MENPYFPIILGKPPEKLACMTCVCAPITQMEIGSDHAITNPNDRLVFFKSNPN